MVHQSVSTFVGKVKSDDSLKQRLQSADLAELLAIAHEHDLHLGEAKALYENAKQALELWGVGHSDAAAQAPSPAVGSLLQAAQANPELQQKLAGANLEQLLELAHHHSIDLGHAKDLYAKARESVEIW
ncbi:MAG: Nif11 family protein [Synechococcus sp.]|nr:Nif11 family protein [Synechococcus sp.]